MSLPLYRIFVAVAQTGSLQRASEELNYSPSAISHSISRLEDKYGFKLIMRTGKGIKLTSCGEEILPFLINTLEWEKQADAVAKRVNGLESGSVRLGVLRSVSGSWLSEIVSLFHSRYPDIKLFLSEHSSRILESMVHSGELDMALISTPLYGDLDNLLFDELFEDPFLCLMPKNEFPATGSIFSLAEFKESNFFIPASLYEHNLQSFFNKNGLDVKCKHELNSDSSIAIMVASGAGWAILTSIAMKEISNYSYKYSINAFPIEKNPSRTIGLLTQPNIYMSPATTALRNLIIEFNENDIRRSY